MNPERPAGFAAANPTTKSPEVIVSAGVEAVDAFADLAAGGLVLAAVLSGDPVQLLWGNLRHGALVMASGATNRMLVGELQPYIGSFDLVIVVMLLCAHRALSGRWTRDAVRNPPFLLGALGWVRSARSASSRRRSRR